MHAPRLRIRNGLTFAIACALGASLVRCSLFVDTDGLNGGASDASAFDSSSGDAQFSSDASSDAGNASDASLGFDAAFPGCASPHAACDDFETGSFNDRWNSANVYGGGVTEYVDDASVSPTHALHSAIPSNSGGAGAALYQQLTIGATSIHCQLDVLIRPSNPKPWNAFGLSFVVNDAGISDYYASVSVGSTETQIFRVTDYADGGSDYDEQDAPPIASGVWTPIVMDMKPSGGTEMVTVTIGTSAPLTRPFGAPVGTSLSEIQVSEDESTSAVDMLVDNVLCDVQ